MDTSVCFLDMESVEKNSRDNIKLNSDVGHATQLPCWQVILEGFLRESTELMSGNPPSTYSRKDVQGKMLNYFFHMKIGLKIIIAGERGVEQIVTDEQERQMRREDLSQPWRSSRWEKNRNPARHC